MESGATTRGRPLSGLERNRLPIDRQGRARANPPHVRDAESDARLREDERFPGDPESLQIVGKLESGVSRHLGDVEDRLIDGFALSLRGERGFDPLLLGGEKELPANLRRPRDTLFPDDFDRRPFVEIGNHEPRTRQDLHPAGASGDRVFRDARLVLPISNQAVHHEDRNQERGTNPGGDRKLVPRRPCSTQSALLPTNAWDRQEPRDRPARWPLVRR